MRTLRKRPSRWGRWATILSGLATPAQAQISMPVDNFSPAASSRRYFVTDDGPVLNHLQPSIEMWGNYAKSPLQLVDSETGRAAADLLEHRWDVDVMIAMGFFDRLELGVVVPATLSQSGERLAVLDRSEALGAGLRDLRIVPKLLVARTADRVLNLSVSAPVSLPTGKSDEFLGAGGVGFAPRAIVSFDTDRFDLAVNAGFRYREARDVAFSASQSNLAVGSQAFGSVGVKLALAKDHLDLVGDVFSALSVDEQDAEEVPIETLGGLRAYFDNGLVLNAGGGAGLSRGIGTPAYRLLAGIGYTYQEDLDRDRDGIANATDGCPEDPEDADGFRDADGCPDPDNDGDGVVDAQDRCPVDPEDVDGFQDTDGCPDDDNDRDGIADARDQCPLEAEDLDNVDDTDGCPDNDNDRDGILDAQDQCPAEPEDVDTFQDVDGCPDPDNDQDGIVDARDQCPLEAEDLDSFEDVDGCPDLDNDQDGIADASDQCPLEPETINGNQDEDGCPDKAKGPVQIEHGKVTTPPVYFATGRDVILEQSYPILIQVAETFEQNPWIKRVRIEGHTDNRGSDDFNLKLSQSRAESVQRFLAQHGIDPARIESVGYGETRPIVDNATRKGRARNRRVEFVIVEPRQSAGGAAPAKADGSRD